MTMSFFRRLDDVPYHVTETLAKRHGGWGVHATLAVGRGESLPLPAARADAVVGVAIGHLVNMASSSHYTPLIGAVHQRAMRKALKGQPERATLLTAHGLLHYAISATSAGDVYRALLADLEAELPLSERDQRRLGECHRLALVETDPSVQPPAGVVTGLILAREIGEAIDEDAVSTHRQTALNYFVCELHAGALALLLDPKQYEKAARQLPRVTMTDIRPAMTLRVLVDSGLSVSLTPVAKAARFTTSTER